MQLVTIKMYSTLFFLYCATFFSCHFYRFLFARVLTNKFSLPCKNLNMEALRKKGNIIHKWKKKNNC